MGLSLVLSALESRSVRTEIAGSTGIRTIGSISASDKKSWFDTILKGLKAVGGWLVKAVGWLLGGVLSKMNFNFTGAFQTMIQSISFAYNFNWQQTDAQMDQYLKNLKIQLASVAGGTFGNSLGYLVCGVIPSAGVMLFNEPLGLYLLKEVGEEALEEFLSNLQVLVFQSLNYKIQKEYIERFKATRAWIKKTLSNPDSIQSKLFKKVAGDKLYGAVQTWGDEGNKPWSIRQYVEEKIDSIKDPELQAFIEEAYDEFLDACMEAGYIIAGGLDNWVLQQRQANQNILGQERTVELYPDRTIENERIVIHGSDLLIRQAIPQVMATYQMVENRDIGQIIGEPIVESIKANTSPISLKLVFYSNPTPPFNSSKVIAQYSISDVKKSKLDWQQIKLACGGKNGYFWGRYKATAFLDNRRKIEVFGASESEAEDRVNAFVQLSNAEILSLSITEEKKTGMKANGKPLEKETTKIYPAYMTVVTAQKVLNESQGKPSLKGNYSYRRNRIPLWVEQKPDDFEQIINELLYVPGIG